MNQAAIEILSQAVEQLQAIGVDCLVSPASLPQGEAVALYVGEAVLDVVAADVAGRRGADLAHRPPTAGIFASDVAEALAEATVKQAAHSARSG